MIRLGLCCKFIEAPIRFRTTTAAHLKKLKDRGENPLTYLQTIVTANVKALEQSINYCRRHHIGCFRIASDFLPVCTHPEAGYDLKDLPDAEQLKRALIACGESAKENGIRLSFHPDQFVILSSADEEVVHKSLRDLEYHGNLAVLVGADVVNIHGGGAYGDKASALDRFADNFQRLSTKVKQRLTVENDDRVYTPADLLPLCEKIGIPLVYDAHHHRCLPDDLSIEKATQAAIATWDREPLFHISSPLEGWSGAKPHRHHDYIDVADMPDCWRGLGSVTVEVEAKAKELAVQKLRSQLRKKKWPIE